MKMSIVARKMTLRPSFSERTQEKLNKLDKFFRTDAECTLTLTPMPRDVLRVEATVRSGGMLFRAETTDEDAGSAVDTLIDLLIRQIRKNKTRLSKRLRSEAFPPAAAPDDFEINEEKEFNIVRTKRFSVKPMSPEEAILQMNLLDHEFFVFRNVNDAALSVVYKRKSGGYGLIETDEE